MQNDMRDRLVELIKQAEHQEVLDFFNADLDEQIDMSGDVKISCGLEFLVHYLIANGVIMLPCKVGDKVAVRALCECVSTIPDNDECRYICPFEDDCECEDCDNANERIFITKISGIFNDGFGWKVTFKDLGFIEANISDIGTSFFVGKNAREQAEQKLKEMSGE